MATWKKVIVSGSNAELNQITASGGINSTLPNQQQSNFVSYNASTGQLGYFGTGSLTAATASFVTASNVYGPFGSNSILSASFAVSSAYAAGGIVSANLTQGTGVTAFTYNGGTAQSVAVSGASALTTNNLTKWTGAAFSTSSLTDNGTTITGGTSIQLTGASSTLSGSFSGSFSGTLTGTASWASNALSAVNANTASFVLTAQTASYVQTAQTASFVLTAQTASFVLQAVSASFATTAATATTATSANSASNITNAITAGNTNNNILTANGDGTVTGESTLTYDGSLLTVNGSANITGNLTVAGTASFTNTDNLTIRDKFILINSGSSTLADSGWITQYNAAGSGSAFYLEAGAAGNAGPYGRFAVAFDVIGTTTTPTPSEYVVTAKINQASNPTDAVPPTWGTGSSGAGNMWITNAGDVFIYV